MPWTKWPRFPRRHFQTYFREWTVLYFDLNFTEVCSQESNWQYPSISLDNGLVLNRRQTIIWNNADPIHWRIYAALGGDGLKKMHLKTPSAKWLRDVASERPIGATLPANLPAPPGKFVHHAFYGQFQASCQSFSYLELHYSCCLCTKPSYSKFCI